MAKLHLQFPQNRAFFYAPYFLLIELSEMCNPGPSDYNS